MSYAQFWTDQLSAKGCRYKTGRREIQATCPYCGRDGHFYANTETGQYFCFGGGCGAKGNVITFLQNERLKGAEIAKVLTDYGFESSRRAPASKPPQRTPQASPLKITL